MNTITQNIRMDLRIKSNQMGVIIPYGKKLFAWTEDEKELVRYVYRKTFPHQDYMHRLFNVSKGYFLKKVINK